MNDNTSFERYVAEAFDREGSGRPVPDAIRDELITYAGRKRQWPNWLAFVKEPPMRLSNSLAVGSPTVRVAAILAATLMLIVAMAAAGVAGKNLLAADGTIVVDAEGDGHFTTITEAVAAAEDGDTVLIKAGTYPESVTVSNAITIKGEEPGAAVIAIAEGCTVDTSTWQAICGPNVPMHENGAYGVLVDGADATIEDVHFHIHTLANSVIVDGGSASLQGLSVTTEPEMGSVLNFVGDSRVWITGSDLAHTWIVPAEDSHLTIDDSDFEALFANNGVDSEPYLIQSNRIAGTIYFSGPIVIEDNEFIGRADGWEPDPQITADGMDWIIRNNTFVGTTTTQGAINIGTIAGPGSIEGNTFRDHRVGLLLDNDTLVEVEGNVFSGGNTGIHLMGGVPKLVDNTIEDMSDFGVTMNFAQPTLSGNTICGNAIDLFIGTGAEPVVDEDNEICVTKTPEELRDEDA